jgi:hypothetical protein
MVFFGGGGEKGEDKKVSLDSKEGGGERRKTI